MNRMRGWGLLLAVGVPMLIFFSWSRLGSETSRINLERYQEWGSGHVGGVARSLELYFLENKKLAGPGDVALPAVPKKSGVKAWSIQPDTTLLVEIDAIIDGHKVQLIFVPIVRGNGVFYDCVSVTSPVHVARFCLTDSLKSATDITAQLAANTRALQSLPAVVTASGIEVSAGSSVGSVLVTPDKVADLYNCGYQCVKPQSCVNPRPLACVKTVDKDNARWQDIVPTAQDFSGNKFNTRTEADQTCEQALGAGYKVLSAASVSGVFKLAGSTEYWVQNNVRHESNCWKTDYQ